MVAVLVHPDSPTALLYHGGGRFSEAKRGRVHAADDFDPAEFERLGWEVHQPR